MSNIGYVLIEQFAAAVERQRRPELAGRPLVIGGFPHERKTVRAASAEATSAGVKAGMALRQAQQLCPTAVFLPFAEECYEEVAAQFLAVVESFSPAVEPAGPGRAYWDGHGLGRLFGAPAQLARRVAASLHHRLGLAASIGLGPTRFTARMAAQLSRPGAHLVVTITPAAFLADLPVEYLSEDVALQEHLRLLGIREIGQFMQLPAAELMEQFGTEGVAAYHLAWGDADPPLLPRGTLTVLQLSMECEPPIEDSASLAHILRQLSTALAATLERRFQACQTVILRLEMAGGDPAIELTTQIREATAQAGAIANAAARLAEQLPAAIGNDEAEADKGHRPPAIAAIQLAVTNLLTQGGSQLSLFDAQRQRRSSLRQAAGEINRRFGNRLKRAALAASASGIAPRFILQDYLE